MEGLESVGNKAPMVIFIGPGLLLRGPLFSSLGGPRICKAGNCHSSAFAKLLL